MTATLQRLLLLVYRAATWSGLLRLPGMDRVLDTAYDLYKRFMEAPYFELLKTEVKPGSTVVDVGANVGFFSRYFAQWTGPQGRVLAIEPEARNIGRLTAMIQARRLTGIVEPIHAAAAERAGQVALTVDPYHPAGHYLSSTGVPTRAVTIDDLVRTDSGRRVSLIKIDVQGAELRVLKGATWTLETFKPAVLVELDDSALRAQGGSVDAVVDLLHRHGYAGRIVNRRELGPVSSQRALVASSVSAGYVDALFTPSPGPIPAAAEPPA